jgi:DNA-binding HxlR family transcriptional regulator
MAKQPKPVLGDCFNAECPAREVLNHISSRWGGLVLGSLLESELRYSQIRTRVDGISEKMLAQTLDVLERDGLIKRTSRPVVPPHVEYALTSSGRAVAGRLFALFDYIGENVTSFMAAHKRYDTLASS